MLGFCCKNAESLPARVFAAVSIALRIADVPKLISACLPARFNLAAPDRCARVALHASISNQSPTTITNDSLQRHLNGVACSTSVSYLP